MKGNYQDDTKGQEHLENLNVWQLNWTVIPLQRQTLNIYQIGWSSLLDLFVDCDIFLYIENYASNNFY